MKSNNKKWILFFSVLILLSCKIPPIKPGLPVSTQAVQANTHTPGVDPADNGENPDQSYIDWYSSGIKSGRWNGGDGILFLLRSWIGKVENQGGINLGQVNDWDASGILRTADLFLKENPNAAQNDELKSILASLRPDPEKMMPYSKLESQAYQKDSIMPASLHRDIMQDDTCANIFNNGFPDPLPGETPPVCVLYRTFSAAGVEFRIFYPRSWTTDISHTQWMDRAVDALRASAETLVRYSAAGWQPTDLVFTTVGGSGAADPAMASVPLSPQRCNIGVYPKALNFNEGDFKQLVAHEMFHCLQYNNMGAAMSLPPAQGLWWQEGSAEYFGNVVYPANNLEYKHLPMLTVGLKTRPIFGLTYKNFYFFQYLGNLIGNDGIISLLNLFGISQSEAEYGQALNTNFSDEGRFFSNFGRQFLDSNVADTGGGNIPVERVYGDQYEMDSTTHITMDAAPFKLTWFRLVFPENNQFTLTLRQSGSGIIAVREMDAPGSWGALPLTFNTAFGRREYLVLLTNVQPGTTFNFQLNSKKKKSDTCDPCLLGSWKLVPESFLPYEREMLQPNINVSSADADLAISFSKEGRSDFNWVSSTVLGTTNLSHGTRAYNIEFHDAGPQSYHYETEDIEAASGTITFTEPSGDLSYQFIIDGKPVSGSLGAADFDLGYGPGQANYTCRGDELTLTPIVPGKFPTGWRMKRELSQ